MVLGIFDLIGNLLLFIVTACWIGFIGFILFGIGGLICFAVGEVFDGIANPLDDLRNWWRHSERINRYRAILRIKWIIWRAIRRLERQGQMRWWD
jgi:hypothetical protein